MKKITYILIVILAFFLGVIGTLCLYNTKEKHITNEVNYSDTGSLKGPIDKIYDAVLLVENYQKDKLVATGTGFVYKKEDDHAFVITNHHVIDKADTIKLLLSSGELVEANIVGSDIYSDVAVLSIDSNYVKQIAIIGNSTNMSLGDNVFTVGSPLGIDYQGTVTKGILSGKDRMITVRISVGEILMDVLQTDAAINEGNSGGPLCNVDGEVIGINSLKIAGDDTEGMGFAIPIEQAMSIATKIEENGIINRPSIGVSLTDVGSYLLREQNINIPNISEGAVVISVSNNSPASNAGLKKGDVITYIGNNKVKTAPHFRN